MKKVVVKKEAIEHARKKMFFGTLLFLIGLLWYANELGYIVVKPFWPIIFMLVGILLFLKGLYLKAKK